MERVSRETGVGCREDVAPNSALAAPPIWGDTRIGYSSDAGTFDPAVELIFQRFVGAYNLLFDLLAFPCLTLKISCVNLK